MTNPTYSPAARAMEIRARLLEEFPADVHQRLGACSTMLATEEWEHQRTRERLQEDLRTVMKSRDHYLALLVRYEIPADTI